MDDIATMTLDQTRAAAQELLDSTTGDLAGADAERFQALSRRAEQIREQERQRTTAARDLVPRLASGDLHAGRRRLHLPGYGRRDTGDEGRSPAVQQRDDAMRRSTATSRLIDCQPAAPSWSRT